MSQNSYSALREKIENYYKECSMSFKDVEYFTEKDKFLYFPQFVLALYYYYIELEQELKENDKSPHLRLIFEIERVNRRHGEYFNQFNVLIGNKDLLNELLININTFINDLKRINKNVLRITLRDFIVEKYSNNENKSPNYINTLLVQLVNPQKGDTIFDPAVGLGNTLRAAFEYNQGTKLLGQDSEPGIVDIANLNLFLTGYHNSGFKQTDFIENSKAISPPVNIIVSHPTPDSSFFDYPHAISNYSRNHADQDVLFKMLSSIVPYTGRMAVVVPSSYLLDLKTFDFRRDIIENDKLEAVITLPEKALFPEETPSSILVINNKKNSHKKNKFLFIDARANIVSIKDDDRISFEDFSIDEFINEVMHSFNYVEEKEGAISLIIRDQIELIKKNFQIVVQKEITTISPPVDIKPKSPEQQDDPLQQISSEKSFPIDDFIGSIQIVSSKEDIKLEIERFANLYFDETNSVSYQEIKSQLDSSDILLNETKPKKVIRLVSNDQSINAILKVHSSKTINDSQIIVINAYWNYILENSKQKLKINETKETIASFSHTTKNFFSNLQSEVDRLIGTQDKELKSYLKEQYIDKKEIVDSYLDNESKKEDFKVWNTIEGYKKQIALIAKYYKAIEFSLRTGSSKFSEFELNDLINNLPFNKDSLIVDSIAERILVIGYLDKVKQAIIDLVQNAIAYSNNKKCQIDIIRKGVWVGLTISNNVSEFMAKDLYRILGKNRIEKPEGELSSGAGLQTSFIALKESYCEVSLGSYESYLKSKKFTVSVLIPSKK